MKEYFAKDFKSRQNLESQIMRDFGLTPDKKDATISGTSSELAKLHLSSRTVFWGISCTQKDEEVKKEKSVVDRGKRTNYGINNKSKKIK